MDTEDALADGEPLDVRADGVHDAAEIEARHERELVLHERLVRAPDHPDVGRVHRGGFDLHPDLALAGLRSGEVSNGAGGADVVDSEGTHGSVLIAWRTCS